MPFTHRLHFILKQLNGYRKIFVREIKEKNKSKEKFTCRECRLLYFPPIEIKLSTRLY